MRVKRLGIIISFNDRLPSLISWGRVKSNTVFKRILLALSSLSAVLSLDIIKSYGKIRFADLAEESSSPEIIVERIALIRITFRA